MPPYRQKRDAIISRRNSDNSTTFIKARRETDFRRFLPDEEFKDLIKSCARLNHIDWLVIPPRSPHFEILGETEVKSMKRHLHRTVRSIKLSILAFITLLTEIGANINSRPLIVPSAEVNNCLALIPVHSIIGRPITAIPQPSSSNFLALWRNIDDVIRQFWNKWSVDDLFSMQRRNERTTENEQLAVDDILTLMMTIIPQCADHLIV